MKELTTFCHRVEWYHEPLSLLAALGDREFVYVANITRGVYNSQLPEYADCVVYVCAKCVPAMDPSWWDDGAAVERPSLGTTSLYGGDYCIECGAKVPLKYQLPGAESL